MDPTLSSPVLAALHLADLPRLLLGSADFAPVVAALQQGRAATVDGAWGSAAALVAATLGQQAPRTLLIALAHPLSVDPWSSDLRSFAGIHAAEFPAWDAWPVRDTVADEVAGQRLRVLKQLESETPPRLLLTTMQALLQPVPDRAQLAQQRRRLRVGEVFDLEGFTSWLVARGFQRRDAVEIPGEFSRRGGIFDVFSPDAEAPYRVELFGDEIDSLRQFNVETQRSLGALQVVEVVAFSTGNPEDSLRSSSGVGSSRSGHLCDYLPPGTWTLLLEPPELHEQGKHFLERAADVTGLFSIDGVFKLLIQLPSIQVTALPASSMETTCHLRVESVERFSGDVSKVKDELDSIAAQDQVVLACHNEASAKRMGEVLGQSKLREAGRLHITEGRVHAGFRMLLDEQSTKCEVRSTKKKKTAGEQPEAAQQADASASFVLGTSHYALPSLLVLGDHELFHREEARTVGPRRQLESRAIDSFLELREGDLVVHVSHGIARYRGMEMVEKNGHAEEHLILEFREGVRVFVPASKIELVQKYIGTGKLDPELSKLGGTGWQRRKDKAQAAVQDLASEMLELQAAREAQPGVAYPPDTDWQAEFEASFPYQETPDQLTSLAEIKRDMQRTRPMDRLICGDVGYGKTELAMRAAFKTVDNGKQVAVLVPTTILAEQHYRTFSQRFAEYPFVVEMISRFRTATEQRRILKRVAEGGVDVLIGTHRVVSADVQFKDLGLVVIDEEQRFGVEHKERLKRLRQTVDVLTLTATPIPRTLHLSLVGIRDISNLTTAPRDRLAIETRIVRFDPQLIRHAILRELNRDGQVYFVHNRVHNIHDIAGKLQSIVPEARIVVGHGQMNEHELEDAMVRFVQKQADILVATTIIESGLDIPNANTIFINQAENYGLADLHQLRGRVGRYKHRAYAYLLLDQEKQIAENAGRRLKAIEEFTELGAGFKIALRDLEIRGAGNILGTEQSGHIAAVGYELYCQLLENAVRHLKQLPSRVALEVTVQLPWPAFLPRDYVPGHKLKIEIYRRLARLRKLERLEDFRKELRERFGPIPEAAEWLLRLAELRLLAGRWQILDIHLEGQAIKEQVGMEAGSGPTDVVLVYHGAGRMRQLAARSQGRLRVVDAQAAYFRLLPTELAAESLYAALRLLLRPAK